MAPISFGRESDRAIEIEEIMYIRQMLGQLRRMADREGAELLCYLIDMAYIEAGETQSKLTPAVSKRF
ncbi:hypothetical protein [Martelella mediterranea]|uniref:Uncharacterized protein n=1 Tax=Martelella mediterranea TaxID=293089 RepID=A0A4R3NXR6_9HYPH|nr:hypothetical protein [Martelella mediterranea]TCT39108.1 hypothetical protein EDC90_101473 [Martelella mediterranea]